MTTMNKVSEIQDQLFRNLENHEIRKPDVLESTKEDLKFNRSVKYKNLKQFSQKSLVKSYIMSTKSNNQKAIAKSKD